MSLGQRIKQIRLNHGETMKEFAKHFNASKGNVNNWEKGHNKPNPKRLKKIAKLGNMTVNELLAEEKSYKLIVETIKKEVEEKSNMRVTSREYDYINGIKDGAENILATIEKLEKKIK